MNNFIQTDELISEIKEDLILSINKISSYYKPVKNGERLKAGPNPSSLYFDDQALIEAVKVYIKWFEDLNKWGTENEVYHETSENELIPQHLKLYGSKNSPSSKAILNARDSLVELLNKSDDLCLMIIIELQAYISSMTYFQKAKSDKKKITKLFNKHSEHVNYFKEIGFDESIIRKLQYSFVNKHPEYGHLMNKDFYLFYFNKEINYIIEDPNKKVYQSNTGDSQKDWYHLCMYKILENSISSDSGPIAIIIALLSQQIGDRTSGDIIRKIKKNSVLNKTINLHFDSFYSSFIEDEELKSKLIVDHETDNEITIILFPFDQRPERAYQTSHTPLRISNLKDLPILE